MPSVRPGVGRSLRGLRCSGRRRRPRRRSPGRRDLGGGGVVRHDDRRRHAEQRAASAMAWAWLPDEKVTTPARRWRASKRDSALKAPRNLKAPMRWKFSHLKNRLSAEFGVRRTRGQHRRAVGVACDARARRRRHRRRSAESGMAVLPVATTHSVAEPLNSRALRGAGVTGSAGRDAARGVAPAPAVGARLVRRRWARARAAPAARRAPAAPAWVARPAPAAAPVAPPVAARCAAARHAVWSGRAGRASVGRFARRRLAARGAAWSRCGVRFGRGRLAAWSLPAVTPRCRSAWRHHQW